MSISNVTCSRSRPSSLKSGVLSSQMTLITLAIVITSIVCSSITAAMRRISLYTSSLIYRVLLSPHYPGDVLDVAVDLVHVPGQIRLTVRGDGYSVTEHP